MTLRKARQDDIQTIYAIQQAAFADIYRRYQDVGNPVTMQLEGIQQRLEQSGSAYYLIEKASQVIGFIRAVSSEESIRISPIAIEPAFQGRGYGRQAMTELECLLGSDQVYLLSTILQEKGLCHFYESLGYQRVDNPIPIQNGMDLVYYRKWK